MGKQRFKIHIAFFIFLFGGLSSMAYETSSSESEESSCTIIEPKKSSLDARNTTDVDLLKLLNEGSSQLDLSASQATLILGNTGSGKTTLTQIIAGDLSSLEAVTTNSGKMVIIDTGNRIGDPSTVSKTLIPELVVQPGVEPNAIYDCPGFDDTRGPKMDIAANYFLNQVVKSVSQIKLIFTVIHSSVTFHERLEFDRMVTHASNFLKDVQKYKRAIALVVTKVKNYSERKKYIKDKRVLNGTVEFLQLYLENLQEESTREENVEKQTLLQNKVKLVETFLTKDVNGAFSQISFSRDPEKCGKLSNSTTVNKTKEKLTSLLKSLQYESVDSNDFGFSLKPETSLYIIDALREINERIVFIIERVFTGFEEWFEQNHLDEPDINMKIEYLELLHMQLNELATNLERSKKADEYGRSISSTLNAMQFRTTDKFTNFMKTQEKYLDFFEGRVSQGITVRDIKRWKEPVAKLRKKLQEEIGKVCNELNLKVTADIIDIARNFRDTIFTRNLEGLDINQLSRNFDNLSQVLGRLVQQINGEKNLEQIAKLVGYVFGDFSRINVDAFKSILSRHEKAFVFLEGESDPDDNLRNWREWIEPLRVLEAECKDYQKWFTFLKNLKEKVSSCSFQASKTQLPERNSKTWLEYINDKQILSGGQELSELPSVRRKGFEIMDKIMDFALKPTIISCNGNEILLKGNFVRLGEIVRGGKLNRCAGKSKIIKIYAADTFFSDEDLGAVGEEIDLIVIAPKWEIVGNRIVNLNGAGALSNLGKATRGEHGQAGNSGGSAGSFYATIETISNYKNIKITADGGNAGNGQDGGDGIDGADGADGDENNPQNEVSTKSGPGDFFYKGKWWEYLGGKGQSGGNGGNGGVPGDSGKPGIIKVNNVKTKIIISESTHRGNAAIGGAGGSPGKPGKGGRTRRCEKHTGVFGLVNYYRSCWYKGDNPNSNGVLGLPGNKSASWKKYIPSKPSRNIMPDVDKMPQEFKKHFSGNNHIETENFIKLLN